MLHRTLHCTTSRLTTLILHHRHPPTTATMSTQRTVDSAKQNTWQPNKYMDFKDIRERPGVELITRLMYHITHTPTSTSTTPASHTAFDLGCGTGNLTRILSDKLSEYYQQTVNVTGIDTSTSMLHTATTESTSHPHIKYQPGDVSKPVTPDGSADVIFSNACLHWVLHHDTLFPNLIRQLGPSTGLLAVQIPANFDAPYHTEITSVLEDLQLIEVDHNNDGHHVGHFYSMETHSEEYYDKLLQPHCSLIDIWHTVYNQVLVGEMLAADLAIRPSDGQAVKIPDSIDDSNTAMLHPVVNFVMGSALSAVLPHLSVSIRAQFLHLFNRRMIKAYPVQRVSEPDERGVVQIRVLFPFKRLFLVARRR